VFELNNSTGLLDCDINYINLNKPIFGTGITVKKQILMIFILLFNFTQHSFKIKIMEEEEEKLQKDCQR
jgi:hypothetical protein